MINYSLEKRGMKQQITTEETFYYFAYGSCMCPVDLKRTFGENTHDYVMGSAILKGYRLGFYNLFKFRNCGTLDIVKDKNNSVEGVLYNLPWRLMERLDERETVKFDREKQIHCGGYRPEKVEVECNGMVYNGVRTYVVVDKLSEELAPNDWYFNVVMRGATTCGLSEEYCWKLFQHMYDLQRRQFQRQIWRSA